mmetsp:Transcript_16679/g.35350  ORF Transcript_16679/g.35350 Transcript_16679/m.35350 type:complete len:418 (-) Transcript_16679:67-1320(-)
MKFFAAFLCALLPLAVAKRVRLIVVRHGQSCANIISDYADTFDINGKLQAKNYPDPLLSDCGRARTKHAAAILAGEHIDFVGSSVMMRAIETAFYQFGERVVHVLPHIAEESKGMAGAVNHLAKLGGIHQDTDNTPLPRSEQIEILKANSDVQTSVDFTWAPAADEENPSSWSHFEEFLSSTLLPSLGLVEDGKTYTIAIASHSHFIKDALGQNPDKKSFLGFGGRRKKAPSIKSHCRNALPLRTSDGGRNKPHNNQALEFYYDFQLGPGPESKAALVPDLTTPCRSLGASDYMPVGVPSKPKNVCEADFARCVDFFSSNAPRPVDFTDDVRLAWGTEESAARLEKGECLTAHECVPGFPRVVTEEQKWADEYRKALTWLSTCETSSEHAKPYPDFCKDQYTAHHLPAEPQQCQCQA